MCKDKWNSFNFDYKKIVDYHKGTNNHTHFWDFVVEKKDKYHLPRQLCRNFYDLIKEFQGERNVTISLHFKNINVKSDEICILTLAQVAHET
jgi:hypothetical protein